MPKPASSTAPPSPRDRDDLAALLERARQERFRLLALLRDAREAVQTSAQGAAAPEAPAEPYSEDIHRLIRKVERLSTAVTQRLAKLEDAETRAKGQIDHLERLEMKMTNLAERFEQLVTDAREVEPVLHGAEARARQLRDQVAATMGQADEVNRALREKLDASLRAHGAKLDQAMTTANEDLLIRGQQLDERLAGLADLFDHQADQIMEDLKTRANAMLDQMALSIKTAVVPAVPPRVSDADTDDAPQLKVA